MIKDTFFSFSRFGKLCRKEILENWKLYVLQLLVMYLIMAIILIWYSYTDYSSFNILTKTNDLNVHIFTLVFWMWSWWAFMCLGTSFAFKTMKCKTGRITMLMILLLSLRSFSFDGWYMCLFFLYLFFYLFGWRIIHVYFFILQYIQKYLLLKLLTSNTLLVREMEGIHYAIVGKMVLC